LTGKPKLLILSGTFPDMVCGTSNWIYEVITRLSRRNLFDIHILTSDDPKINPEKTKPFQIYPIIKKWGLLQTGSICRKIQDLHPDIIYIQNPTIQYSRWGSFLMSWLVPRLKRSAPQTRIVVMQHDLAISHPCFRWRYRPLLQAADAVIISNSRDALAAQHLNIDSQKIYRAPLSTHFHLHQPGADIRKKARTSLNLPQGDFIVAFFGFILPGRNIDILIRALAQLRRDGRPVHGLIIGGPHEYAPKYFEKCQKLAGKLGLQPYMTWTGYASEEQVADGLAAADVFVSLLQRGADLRNSSILTGILAGLPVITSRNSKYYNDPDLEKLGCGCVDPWDPQAVAVAIKEVMENPPDVEILKHRARVWEPQRIWNHSIEVQIQALQGGPPPPPLEF